MKLFCPYDKTFIEKAKYLETFLSFKFYDVYQKSNQKYKYLHHLKQKPIFTLCNVAYVTGPNLCASYVSMIHISTHISFYIINVPNFDDTIEEVH